MPDNADVARAQTSLETYEQIVRNYQERYDKGLMSERNRLWFETVVRQRDLKRREVRRA